MEGPPGVNGLSKSNLLYLVAYYSVDVDARKCALTGMEGSPRGTAQCVFQANITGPTTGVEWGWFQAKFYCPSGWTFVVQHSCTPTGFNMLNQMKMQAEKAECAYLTNKALGNFMVTQMITCIGLPD